MKLDKQIMNALGLNDTTITFGLDEDIQIAIEHKIDNYLKKLKQKMSEKNKWIFTRKHTKTTKRKMSSLQCLMIPLYMAKSKTDL